MKKIVILPILFIGFYAQAESIPQAEPTIQTESVQTESDQEKTGFFSFSLGGEVTPNNFINYHSTTVDIKFGGKISQHSSFGAGVKITTGPDYLFAFQYVYNFIKSNQWIPGVDFSLLVGPSILDFTYDHEDDSSGFPLTGGFEFGPHLKTFISKSHALLLRTGVTILVSKNNRDDDIYASTRIYLNLGFQWHF